MSSLDLASGKKALDLLLQDLSTQSLDLNEAETRHLIIDRLIHECLGWDRRETKLERPHNGDYSDYELGIPPGVLIEAKRAGISFDIPCENNSTVIRSIKSICSISPSFRAAFLQAQKYCADRGIQLGAVSNGIQLIIFLGVRSDGIPPIEGKCLLFKDWVQIENHFDKIWQAISPAAENQKLLLKDLTTSSPTGVPRKLSNFLHDYPKFRFANDFQQSLRTLSDLLIEDAPNTPAVRKKFYEECYCETGALAKESMVGKDILSARYAAMFSPSKESPTLESINSSKQSQYGVGTEVVAEALGRRPIVIMGDVGVGKTSFIRNLIYVKATKEIENSIYIYIDLGNQASLGQDLHSFFIKEIESQLLENYQVDLYQDRFVRGVYHSHLKRFESGIYRKFKESDPEKYLEKEIEFLEKLLSSKIDHLKESIKHISHGRKKQIIISIDNADQRSYSDQQEAFLAAQEFSSQWSALVLISLRPQTYFASKTSGSISGYPQRILTISPPRVDLVLQKRLQFSLDLAEGKLPLDKLDGISIKLDSIALFLKALLFSLRNNKEISELLSNITGGNIREALDIIKGFVGSANVDSNKIIEIMRKDGEYTIPLHEFTKQALLGEFSHYESKSSIALNLFDTYYADPKEHFLACLLIGYLLSNSPHKNTEGFLPTGNIIHEMQGYGFVADQIEHSLRRLTNKKLIETTERITFDEGLQGLVGEMPIAFRPTSIGAYHVQRWAGEFSYLDAMVFDTPIFKESITENIIERVNSFDIEDRYKRTSLFADYLDEIWSNLLKHPSYFDWTASRKYSQNSFSSVKRFIDKKNTAN